MNTTSKSCITGWISYQLVGTEEEAKEETGDLLNIVILIIIYILLSLIIQEMVVVHTCVIFSISLMLDRDGI